MEDINTKEQQPTVFRDERGRLLPGSRLSLGFPNRTAARAASLRQQWIAAATPECLKESLTILFGIMRGDNKKLALQALELWLAYALGKPKESIEVSTTQPALDLTAYSDEQLDSLMGIITVPARSVQQPVSQDCQP